MISDVFTILWVFSPSETSFWTVRKTTHDMTGDRIPPKPTCHFTILWSNSPKWRKEGGQKNAGSFLKALPAIFSSRNTEGEFLVAPKNYQQLNEPLPGVFPGSAIFRNNSGTSVLKSKEMLWGYALIWCFVPCDLQLFQLSAHGRLPWQADSTGLCRQSRGFRKICKKIDKKCQDRCVFFKFPVGKNTFFVASIGGFGDLGIWIFGQFLGMGHVEGILRRIHEFSALFRDHFISHTKQFKEYEMIMMLFLNSVLVRPAFCGGCPLVF